MFTNSRSLRIEWGDCDPAGIVFYPRYFAMFDASTAFLLEKASGMKKIALIKASDSVGCPMVDTRAQFFIPTRFGDDVVIETAITEVKRSSFSLRHHLRLDGALAVEGFETRVWVGRDPNDPDKIKSKPLPPELAERLAKG
jgi:4-hydroxybenzoyl-CoA thioesterase